MTDIDSQALLQACMADLRRERQEELPLNNRAKSGKGPTFRPSARNSTEHIRPEVKQRLQGMWSKPIQDEESEQVQGLKQDDARPWAKEVAKPFIQRMVKKAQIIPPALADITNSVAPAPAAVPVSPHPAVAERPPSFRAVAAASRPHTVSHEAEKSLLEGRCLILEDETYAGCYEGSYALVFKLKENRAFLRLAAKGLLDQHDLLQLERPQGTGTQCLIRSRAGSAKCTLELSSEAEAEKLRNYFDKAQQSAARHSSTAKKELGNQTKETTKETPPPITTRPEPAPARTTDMFGAVSHLAAVVRKTLPELARHGIEIKSSALGGVEDAAIESWLQRGVLEMEEDDLSQRMLKCLRELIRVQTEIELRNGSHVAESTPLPPQAFAHNPALTVADDGEEGSFSGLIDDLVQNPKIKSQKSEEPNREPRRQYTREELETLGQASGGQAMSSIINAPPSQRLEVKKNASGVPKTSQHYNRNENCPKQGLASSMWSTELGKMMRVHTPHQHDNISDVHMASPLSPSPVKTKSAGLTKSQPMKGLSSSRWATGPVSCEGQFPDQLA